MRFIAQRRLCMTHTMTPDIALACMVLAKVLHLRYQVKIPSFHLRPPYGFNFRSKTRPSIELEFTIYFHHLLFFWMVSFFNYFSYHLPGKNDNFFLFLGQLECDVILPTNPNTFPSGEQLAALLEQPRNHDLTVYERGADNCVINIGTASLV